ncbi:carbohydrate esterase family 12 protein [Cylindrobasidium torrendii FP15055 ss-10]|uniref:Carbohydrate esterase family 12 protein n=1 Tax=Cylindrobasidium torrendii FP15055 ss-10 TaxID=1314674 RepID=A0A0D7B280_9AGAR|nr:carbohydrate esterase family 12 protein [Cylindrobasidium torrendii FP15055 ss-10]
MRVSLSSGLLGLVAAVHAQTVYLAGDSTMAATGAADGDTAGWGAYLTNYISLSVANRAIAGRSARSYTRDGRFDQIKALVKSGDFVVIEFGHNDGGSLATSDNGRSDCEPVNGDYSTTCTTTYNGVTETVLTYEKYLANAAKAFKALGANVIISSATPNNVWETGTFTYSANRFVTYAQDAATEAGVTFADHGIYTASLYKNQGADVVNAYYPNDHTHTSPAGANVVARAFVLAVEATSSTLNNYITHD